MIYADFEGILVPEDNEKQNSEEFHTDKYQKHVANITVSYSYKLLYAGVKFSKPFQTYLGKDAVYNFVNNIIEEGKYCSDMIKKHFNKELVMNKDENKKIKNSTKCWICDNDYIDDDVKVRDHCNITGKK